MQNELPYSAGKEEEVELRRKVKRSMLDRRKDTFSNELRGKEPGKNKLRERRRS